MEGWLHFSEPAQKNDRARRGGALAEASFSENIDAWLQAPTFLNP